ncbi:MAG: thioredoxin-disulfide reductase [Proteobacteria bacterium]|nr:thioredoxin-disulfide reductase [Pseudomonadota bacterium]
MSDTIEKMVIVGTGPAGLTAAIYGARSGLSPTVYAGIQPGGQLTTTTEVENFPGFSQGILGPKLMEEMTEQAKRVGSKIINEAVTSVETVNSPSGAVKKLWTSDGGSILAHTVILCTGATAKTLGLDRETELMGHGVSTCATCDGFFYRKKHVVVVGGGDSAMEEALFLANLAEKVVLIHRRALFRASHIMLERAKKHPNIEMMVPYTVCKLLEKDGALIGVTTQHSESQEQRDLPIDGLFYAIGHTPNSQIFRPWVDTDDQGYVIVHDYVKTKTSGVFVAGDLCDPHFRQAITAAGLGCRAAMTAIRYLDERNL